MPQFRRSLTSLTALAGLSLSIAVAGLPAAGAAPATTPEPATPQETVSPGTVPDNAPDGAPETVLRLGPDKKPRTYLVQLDKAAVPARGTGRSRAKTPTAPAWRSTLKADQRSVRSAMTNALGSAPAVGRTFTEAVNGFSVTLTGAQARRVAELPGVRAVTVADLLHPTSTSNGADLVKADALWTGTGSNGVAVQGDGIVVGVIDTGINPANPSFAASVSVADGGDGQALTNPRGAGNHVGMCDPTSQTFVANWGCNDKLIGAWNLTTLAVDTHPLARSPYDDHGHGSHTASTAAGNQVRASWPAQSILPDTNFIEPSSSVTSTLSGVAPHANLISYDICATNTAGRASCLSVDAVAAYEQAIRDGVDVINYSISTSPTADPWSDPVAQAQLNARKAGIGVSTSAGNSGPNASTATHTAPWVTNVANTSHDLSATVGSVAFTSATGQASGIGPFPTMTLSSDLPTATSIVQARDIDTIATGAAQDGYCMPGTLPSTAATGKVVLCDRGNNARINKGRVVKDAGGVGLVLVNATVGEAQARDVHVLPTAHLTKAQGDALRALLAAAPSTRATIVGGSLGRDPSVADRLNSTSSRGPANNGTGAIGVSLSAPGTSVLAAGGTNNAARYELMTGTSMASPHVAGSMALLKQLHPDWTQAEISSALMTTADTSVRDSDGTAATWFEQGSGRVDLSRAGLAGLVLDTPAAAYDLASPATGGDARTLNGAQITDTYCGSCHLERTVSATATGLGTWTASVHTDDPNLELSVADPQFSLARVGQQHTVRVQARVLGPVGTWRSGSLVLTPPPGSTAPVAHLPIALTSSAGVMTGTALATHREQGTRSVGTARLPFAASEAAWSVSEPTTATVTTMNVAADTTPDVPYNTGSGDVRALNVPSGVQALVVSVDATSSPDIDLRVGTGPTPSAATQVCQSAQLGSREQCVVENPAAGTWWVLVQNYTSSGTSDPVTTSTALLTEESPATHLEVTPEGAERSGSLQRLTLGWDAPLTEVGTAGFVRIRATNGQQTLSSVVRVAQHAPDVEVAPLPAAATVTGELSPQLTVHPDRTGDAPVHDVRVRLPAGWTVDGPLGAGGTRSTASGVTTVRWNGTHAALSAAAGTDASGPVTLRFHAVVTAPEREGDTVQVVTEESVAVPGGGSSSRRTHDVVVTGGTYPTSTTLSLSSTSSTDEAAPQATATIRVAGTALAAPTGTVTVLRGTTPVGTAPLDHDGSARVELTGLAVGSHSLTVRYAGDASNRSSTSAPVVLSVGTVQHPTSLALTAPSRTTQQQASLEVVVTGGPADATGTVTVSGNGRTLGTGAVVGGRGVVNLGTLAAGQHSLSVQYSGDTKHLPSHGTTTLVVDAPPRAAVTVTARAPRAVRKNRRAKPLTVRVRATGTTPRGSVTITAKGAGRTLTRTTALPTTGTVKVSLGRYRRTGKVKVTVAYAGDATTLPTKVTTRFTVKK